jgi:uncharacterized protein (UPF0332 family)
MTWNEMSVSSLAVAQAVSRDHARSAVSRAYYSAHVALAQRLLDEGYVPPAGVQTQPHRDQARLIKRYLAGLGQAGVRQMVTAFGRLYSRRIDADYKRTVTIDRAVALDSLRDTAFILHVLKAGVK